MHCFDYGELTDRPALVSCATTGTVLSLNESGLDYFKVTPEQIENKMIPDGLSDLAHNIVLHMRKNEEAAFLYGCEDDGENGGRIMVRCKRIPDQPHHILAAIDKGFEQAMGVPADFYSESEYEEQLALLCHDETEGEYSVYVNLTQNTIEAARSILLHKGNTEDCSAERYFEAVLSSLINKKEKKKLSRILERKKLASDFASGKKQQSYELEMIVEGAFYWRRLTISMLRNARAGDLVAIFTWKNINDWQFRQKILNTILAETYDFIGCIFPTTNSYMMVQNLENNKLYPDRVASGYEEKIWEVCESFASDENKEYLKYCFSIKNLARSLK